MTPLCLAVLALLVLGGCVAVAAHRPPSGGAQVPEEQRRLPPALEDDDDRWRREEDDDNGADGENVTATATAARPGNNGSAGHHRAHGDPLFPKDLFTTEQLRHGAVLFHIIGLVGMGADGARPKRLRRCQICSTVSSEKTLAFKLARTKNGSLGSNRTLVPHINPGPFGCHDNQSSKSFFTRN